MLKIWLFLAFTIWSILDGFKDAYLFHYQSIVSSNKMPPHVVFTAHRWVIGALVLYISKDWIFCISLVMMFSFFHNGSYYQTRHNINNFVYKKGWMDDSVSSTALFDMNFETRSLMAVVGFLIMVLDILVC